MVLNIVCPNTIYPYLRSNVADVIQRAGFPPDPSGRDQLRGALPAEDGCRAATASHRHGPAGLTDSAGAH